MNANERRLTRMARGAVGWGRDLPAPRTLFMKGRPNGSNRQAASA